MEEELRALKVVDLQNQLKTLGLNTKGKKEELIQRLIEAKKSSVGVAEAESKEKRPLEEEQKEEQKDQQKDQQKEEQKEEQKEQKETSSSSVSSSTTVLLRGFVRPFTEEQAREFVGNFGESALSRWQMGVTRAWAVAQFESAEKAADAVKRMDGAQWPAKNSGSKLIATIVASFEEGLELGQGEKKKENSNNSGRNGNKKKEEEEKKAEPARAVKIAKVEKSRVPELGNFHQTKTTPVLFYTCKD